MTFSLNNIDWTAISSIATLIMVVATFVSLRQNKRQLKEMKRQWYEEQRPRLNISVIISQRTYFLRIYNTGHSNAYNIKLSINDDFVSNIKDTYRDVYKSLQSSPFFIEGGISKYLLIGFCDEVCENWKNKTIDLNVKGQYCNQYQIDETLHMDEFINKMHFIVNDELTTTIGYIKKGLVVQNDQYYPVQKSLDIIAKQIVDMNKKNKENEPQ